MSKKSCPFNNNDCDESCSLYINIDELNEVVKNKLASIGVLPREGGICSLKNIALCSNRFIFENTSTNFSR